jgi:hypothetical protein
MPMTRKHFLAVALGVTIAQAGFAQGDPRAQFYATLKSLCGVRFEGAMTFPKDTTHDMHGKKLTAIVEKCDDNELRVPFLANEDRSRTWVFTKPAGGLQLKHDHRHADGTPDSVTNYGGLARAGGTATSQSFPADAFTAKLIPAAATNVWTVSLSSDGSTLTYHLERDAKPRFTAELRRAR